ncbi:MAG: hypothetical protein QOC67_516 [Pseudonocardiales bacterium]|jgi:hypothetical protein|nr:hypothetical protein [Pseudonocardiales bacterium]
MDSRVAQLLAGLLLEQTAGHGQCASFQGPTGLAYRHSSVLRTAAAERQNALVQGITSHDRGRQRLAALPHT